MTKFLSLHLEEFAISAGIAVHTNCRNKAYMRLCITSIKAIPFVSLGLLSSFFPALKQIQGRSKLVTYPYQMMLGEKDTTVNNNMAK